MSVTKHTAFSVALFFVLNSSFVHGEELHDIRGPVSLKPDMWPWLILGLALIVVMGWLLFRRQKSPPSKIPLVPPRPAWEIALEGLDILEQSRLLAEGRFKEYYSVLSDIVRAYIEARFEIRAPEMTTEEFLNLSRGSEQLQESQKKILGELLISSDMVKFAKHIPLVDQARENLRLAKLFIQETRPPAEDMKNGI
jgi:hypothetical protein